MTDAADVKAIEGVIQSYLDGLHESDADKIASVFHPTSALTSVANGELTITPRDEWLDRVRSRPSPKKQGLSRHDQVLMVDLVSPTMAYSNARFRRASSPISCRSSRSTVVGRSRKKSS